VSRKPILLAAVMLLASGAARAQQQPPDRFNGGPFDGLAIGPIDGRPGPTGPSIPNASPVPAREAPVIEGLVAALKRGDRAALKAMWAVGGEIFCVGDEGLPCDVDQSFRKLDAKAYCSINTPFYLGSYDGSIRLEWVCDGQLAYFSLVTLKDGKIVSMTAESTMTPVVIYTPGKAG